jgi:salicylate hydroxylase
MRDHVLGHPHAPNETGDLAYRGTFSREQLTALNDPAIDEMMKAPDVQDWVGPDAHGVFYPLRNYNEYNLVIMSAFILVKPVAWPLIDKS